MREKRTGADTWPGISRNRVRGSLKVGLEHKQISTFEIFLWKGRDFFKNLKNGLETFPENGYGGVIRTRNFKNRKKIRKKPEKRQNRDFQKTRPRKCYGGVTFPGPARAVDEGEGSTHKSVKNDMFICACDSKV